LTSLPPSTLRRFANALGAIAILSWFGLYLEIFRYHHLVLSQIGRVAWPSETAGPRPGGFLRSVIVCSILAPILFVVLWTATRVRMARFVDAVPARAILSAPPISLASGVALIVLAVINQIIRRPPIVVDLTFRTGNGGFVVVGLALAIIGAVLRYRKVT
jgi:hypothetical protein